PPGGAVARGRDRPLERRGASPISRRPARIRRACPAGVAPRAQRRRRAARPQGVDVSRARLRVGVDGRVLAIPTIRGGTRYATNLLRALSARDDVELIVFAREPPCAHHLAGVRAQVVRAEMPREVLWNDWWLPRRLRAERVDVFHALADRGLPCW